MLPRKLTWVSLEGDEKRVILKKKKKRVDIVGGCRSFSHLILTFFQGLCRGLPIRMQRLLGGRDSHVNLAQVLMLLC